MSNALMGIADRLANEDRPKPTQTTPQDNTFGKIKSAISDLQKLKESEAHVHSISPESLKTLCKLGLVKISVSDKGSQTIDSFSAVESLAGELGGAGPDLGEITQYRKEHK